MLRDGALSIASTALRAVAGLGVFVLMARIWGPEPFGAFMHAYVVAAIVTRLVDYGFSLQLARDAGRASTPREAMEATGVALGAKLVLLVPMLVATTAAQLLSPALGGMPLLFALLMLDATLLSFASFATVPLRALGRFDVEARLTVSGNLGLVVLSGIALAAGGGPLAVAAAFVAARLLQVHGNWAAYARVTGERLVPVLDRPAMRATLLAGLPFAAHAAAGTILVQADALAVESWLGTRSLGIYQAGARILVGALIVCDALNAVYLASIARAVSDRVEAVRLGTRMTRHMLALGALVVAIAAVAAPWGGRVLLRGATGSDELTRILPLLALLMLVRCWGSSYGAMLTLGRRQGVRVVALGLVVVVDCALLAWLTPRFGLVGAAWAAVLAHAVLYGAYAAASWRDHRSLLLERRAGILALSALAVAMLIAAPGERISPAMHLLLGGALGVAAAVLGVSRAEWEALGAAIERRRSPGIVTIRPMRPARPTPPFVRSA